MALRSSDLKPAVSPCYDAPMDPNRQASIDRYFAVFNGKMGHRQAMTHLASLPRWWKLRDRQGRTPLMRAMEAAGFTPKVMAKLILNTPEAGSALDATDRAGRNLWWYLLLHQSYRSDERTDGWVGMLRERVALQPSITSGRGLFIDHILGRGNRQWSGFFPREDFARQVYALPNNRHATWWQCGQDDAEKAAHWLLAVRCTRYAAIARSIGQNLRTCQRQDPLGRGALPMPIRGGLMLLEALHGDLRHAQQEQEAGAWVRVGSRAKLRLLEEAKQRPAIVAAPFEAMLIENEQRALQHTIPTPALTRPLTRL